MPSTVLDSVAQALAGAATALQLELSGSVTAHKWEVGYAGIGRCPAVIVGLPVIERTRIDEPESQLGSSDWTLDYPVVLAVDLDKAPRASAQLAELAESYVKAIDSGVLQRADPAIDDAKVVDAEPVVIADQARPLLAYEMRVGVLKFV